MVCHYTNLRPLWLEENRQKWDFFDGRAAVFQIRLAGAIRPAAQATEVRRPARMPVLARAGGCSGTSGVLRGLGLDCKNQRVHTPAFGSF